MKLGAIDDLARHEDLKIIAWGSYDGSKPRVRLLLEELRAQGVLASEINIDVWKSIRDKAVAGRGQLLKSLLRLLASYPGALIKLIRQDRIEASAI